MQEEDEEEKKRELFVKIGSESNGQVDACQVDSQLTEQLLLLLLLLPGSRGDEIIFSIYFDSVEVNINHIEQF